MSWILAMLCLTVTVPCAWGQAAAAASADTAGAAKAEFEVVSIKPTNPNGARMMIGLQYTPDGVNASGVTVAMLVRTAYGGFTRLPTDDQVTGLPDWAKSQRFEIAAKMSEADAAAFKSLSKDEQDQRRQQMLKSLLAERFKLTAHDEQKQMPDFELVVAKGGPKLQ